MTVPLGNCQTIYVGLFLEMLLESFKKLGLSVHKITLY